MKKASEIVILYEDGLAFLKAEKYTQALDCFTQIIKKTNPIKPLETETEYLVPYQAEPKQFDEVEKKFKNGKPIRLVMDYFTAAIYNAGCVYVAQNKFTQAQKYLEEALMLWPLNTAIKIQVAYVYVKLGNAEQAVNVLTDGLRLTPQDARLLRQLAWTYNEIERFADTIRVASEGLLAHPDHSELGKELLFAAEKLNDQENMEKAKLVLTRSQSGSKQ